MSGSHSDFIYQLTSPVQVPKSSCFVDSVHLANVFLTITSHSRFIYIEEISTPNVSTKRMVGMIAGQNHDGTNLATELATQLNTGTTLTASPYAFTFSGSTGKMASSHTKASPADFTRWSADYLRRGLWNPLNSISIPAHIEGNDCYTVLGPASPYEIVGNSTIPITGEGHISVMPHQT